MNDSFPFRSEK